MAAERLPYDALLYRHFSPRQLFHDIFRETGGRAMNPEFVSGVVANERALSDEGEIGNGEVLEVQVS